MNCKLSRSHARSTGLARWAPMLLVACSHAASGTPDVAPTSQPPPLEETPAPSPKATAQPTEPAATELSVDVAAYDFANNPELVERIIKSPHRYYRFINTQFSKSICQHWEAALAGSPVVSLHGDAHIEQYAATDLGRGLTDFDNSSTGPAAIDLIRMTTSIRLAAAQNKWQADTEAFLEKFFDGYRKGLADPASAAPTPKIVETWEKGFSSDRTGFLKYASKVMIPMSTDPSVSEEKFKATFDRYVKLVAQQNPKLSPTFFHLKKAGLLKVGIGSALDRKFLLRVEGPSAKDDDDAILEVKEVQQLVEVPCIKRRLAPGDSPLTLSEPREGAYNPEYRLGHVYLPGQDFWVHEWSTNYEEVKIDKSFADPSQFEEIVFDIGVQLGAGHRSHDDGSTVELSPLVNALNEQEPMIRKASTEYAAATEQAWKTFMADIEEAGLLPKVAGAQ